MSASQSNVSTTGGIGTDPTVPLNDGHRMPRVGLGVYKMTDEEAGAAVETALAAGYRGIDTAAMYDNEAGVGAGLRRSGVPRSEVFVATKVRFEDNGYDSTLRAFDDSVRKLGTDTVDLYLIHWPAPLRDRYVDAWRALIRLRDEGRARSIGVSNFHSDHLDRIIAETGVIPAVHQIELHPRFPQHRMRAYDANLGIITQAWSPLARGRLLDEPALVKIARARGVTPAQVVLRWHLENDVTVIPKSVNPKRIRENHDLFRFSLTASDHRVIADLETGERTGVDPNDRN
ncbi:aldo/keto reductase [Microbacterium invictum]|uniref:Aldo/keto reductase n=1 Tax=Microbacterium invictum TaxID=515415 RepID=A0ABZ0VCW9_9MICO|nr:aldo/keto reductase [Microbacterium invictum]WQB71079.1 aldo/keto reductase [Microbacterium invictum]